MSNSYKIEAARVNFDAAMHRALVIRGVSTVAVISAINSEMATSLEEKETPTATTRGGKATFAKSAKSLDKFTNSVNITGSFRLRAGKLLTAPLHFEDYSTRMEQVTKFYSVEVNIPPVFDAWLAKFTKTALLAKLQEKQAKETDTTKKADIALRVERLEVEFAEQALVHSGNVAAPGE